MNHGKGVPASDTVRMNRVGQSDPTPGGYNDLPKTAANHVQLSPLSFLPKAAYTYPDHPAIIQGERVITWRETYRRCRQMASALTRLGIGEGDTVAIMAPNIPAAVEVHFGVPVTGAVLNTMNIRLEPEAIAFQLRHAGTRVLFTDRESSPTVIRALAMLDAAARPMVIDIHDDTAQSGELIGDIEYEAFLASGDPDFPWAGPEDEWNAISLNYTSGTTGNPKGVVSHHRGAYLNAVGNALTAQMDKHAVWLWVVPMFHCNGWCFPWTVAAVAGTNICLRKVAAPAIYDLIRRHRVTNMGAAPIVYTGLIEAAAKQGGGFEHRLRGLTGGSAPPAATLEGAARIGIDINHIYGLTETYGPAAICASHAEWAALDLSERARLNARQGVAILMQEAMTVRDPLTLQEVPHDGETIGEIMFRGNLVMKGYLKNLPATEEAFEGGWFHSGDLAVVEPDGYVRIRDRSKDVIISGGENISSIEVEDVLHRHPAVSAAAVVGKEDAKWGEVPCAFIEVREGAELDHATIHGFCRANLAGFKSPKFFVFGAIPRTSTGKVQKYLLREMAKGVD